MPKQYFASDQSMIRELEELLKTLEDHGPHHKKASKQLADRFSVLIPGWSFLSPYLPFPSCLHPSIYPPLFKTVFFKTSVCDQSKQTSLEVLIVEQTLRAFKQCSHAVDRSET